MILTTIDRLAIDRDAELIEALRMGEPTAAEQLFAAYGDRAYRLAVRITGNRGDAEEALQDAFWNVIRKIDTFREESSIGSWIYRIVTNTACQKLRRRAQRGAEISLNDVLPLFDQDGRHATLVTDWSSSLDDPAVQRELRDVLESALAELPPPYRAAVVLRDVEGMSTTDVARALGITVATAKTRTHRARLRLRQRLSSVMASAGSRHERPRERNHRSLHRNGDVRAVA